MEQEYFKDGRCKFQGICEFSKPRNSYKGDDETLEGYIFRIDGRNYMAVVDPDDGYRSYLELCDTDEECTNTFPDQEVYLHTYDEKQGYCRNWGIELHNIEDGSLIFRIGTDDYDDYYPCAIMEFNPENMPINKQSEN